MTSPRLPVVAALFATALRAGPALSLQSPFLPSQAEAAAVSTPELEFVAYIAAPDGPRYRIMDPARKTTTWVQLNQRDPELDVLAKRHDADQDLLFVEFHGRPLTLPMRRSRIGAAGGARPGAKTTAAVSRADAQQQLENLAAAVAQRRALREQAATTASGPAPTPASSPPAAAPPRNF